MEGFSHRAGETFTVEGKHILCTRDIPWRGYHRWGDFIVDGAPTKSGDGPERLGWMRADILVRFRKYKKAA